MTSPPAGEAPRGAALRLAPVLLGLLAALLAFLSSRGASPTDDEPTYIGQGAYLARSGDFRAPVLLWQPPLALYVTSAALGTVDLPDDAFAARPRPDSLTALGDRLLFESPSPPEDVLLASRLPVVAVTGLLAALAAWLAGRLGGARAAWIAGALVAASPMVYGHGGLATTDVAATAAALLAVTPLALAAHRGTWTLRTVLAAGAALGLALLAKHTAIVLVPLTCGAAFLLARRGGAARGAAVRHAAAAVAVAALVVWAGYGFDAGPLVAEDSKGDLAAKLGPAWAQDVARTVPVPAPRYWQSVVFQAGKQHDRLYFQFLGEERKVGWWTYFPVVTAAKATLGSLALVLLAAWTLRARRLASPEALLALAFAVPFAAAVVSRHNLGVRHVLPAVAPLAVLAGVRLGRSEHASRAWTFAVAAAVALHVAEGVSAGRDAVAWWNAAAGGVEGGWRISGGSNADWGQGLWRLCDEVRARGLADVTVIASRGPQSSVVRIERDGLRVHPDPSLTAALPASGWLAVSTSAPRRGPSLPVTDAPPDSFVAGCYRLYRLPLPAAEDGGAKR